MINAVMLAHNRPRLTEQAITSFLRHTSTSYRLMIVDDYSAAETADMLDEYAESHSQTIRVVHSRIAKLGPGLARNIGIKKSEQWGRGDALYLCDNDCYFLPDWDRELMITWEKARTEGFMALGGYCHPFQHPIKTHHYLLRDVTVNEVEALGLLSWLMDWSTWDALGQFDSAVKVNGSEDWNYSQRIRRAGGRVGVLEPAVVINCGVTSSDGKPCPGAVTLYSQDIPQGVLLE